MSIDDYLDCAFLGGGCSVDVSVQAPQFSKRAVNLRLKSLDCIFELEAVRDEGFDINQLGCDEADGLLIASLIVPEGAEDGQFPSANRGNG